MSEEPTCGTGMAAQSEFPQRVAAVMEAMAAVLRQHTTALDTSDPVARREERAWRDIAADAHSAAEQLRATAERMVDARDIPIVDHDMTVMTSPDSLRVFTEYANAQRGLYDVLSEMVAENEAMAAQLDPTREQG